jgi:hypothetical protein
MPVLKYFAVVGLALVSLLFVADSLFSRPEHPVYTAKFDRAPMGLQRGSVMTSQLAPEPPHIAQVPSEQGPSEPAVTATIAPAKAASPSAGKEQAKEPAEATPVKSVREQPVKKRQRAARKHARPQPWREAERGDRWERQGRAERQDRWGRAPWDDTFAFAPRNRNQGRDPFWFR